MVFLDAHQLTEKRTIDCVEDFHTDILAHSTESLPYYTIPWLRCCGRHGLLRRVTEQ